MTIGGKGHSLRTDGKMSFFHVFFTLLSFLTLLDRVPTTLVDGIRRYQYPQDHGSSVCECITVLKILYIRYMLYKNKYISKKTKNSVCFYDITGLFASSSLLLQKLSTSNVVISKMVHRN